MSAAEPARRLALVTGGARRVGRAIVERLAAAGFDVGFTYLESRAEADDLRQRINATGRRCIAIRADLTAGASAVAEIQTAVSAFGRLDALINNASIYLPDGSDQDSIERARRMWAVHVEAPLALCRAFETQLRAARGCVVNMVDLLAERPRPGWLAYSASKAALWNLTLGLARELAPEVPVNGIAPGVIEWPADLPVSERESYLRRVPLGRAGTSDDAANLVEFLCRPAGYMTGQILRLDGGRSLV